MNNILDLILSDDNKPALNELQNTFDLDESQTRAAVEKLIPALSRGLRNNTQQSSGILKKMLPVLATVVMGSLSKKVISGGRSSGRTVQANSGGLLSSLLDSDRDGSIWDDVLGMAARGMLR